MGLMYICVDNVRVSTLAFLGKSGIRLSGRQFSDVRER